MAKKDEFAFDSRNEAVILPRMNADKIRGYKPTN